GRQHARFGMHGSVVAIDERRAVGKRVFASSTQCVVSIRSREYVPVDPLRALDQAACKVVFERLVTPRIANLRGLVVRPVRDRNSLASCGDRFDTSEEIIGIMDRTAVGEMARHDAARFVVFEYERSGVRTENVHETAEIVVPVMARESALIDNLSMSERR